MTGVDILIHNLSHSDLILGVKNQETISDVVARPKFNKFHFISQQLFGHISHGSNAKLKLFPLRSHNVVTNSAFHEVAVGYEIKHTKCLFKYLRFRDDQKSLMTEGAKSISGYNFCLSNENLFTYLIVFVNDS